MQTKPKIQIDLQQAEELASRGLTNEEIAVMLGISESTFYNKMNEENGYFRDAIKRGKSKTKIFVTNKLFKKIKEDEDITAIIFYLKCHGWSDKQEVQISGEVTQKVYQYGWAAAAGVPEMGIKDNDK